MLRSRERLVTPETSEVENGAPLMMVSGSGSGLLMAAPSPPASRGGLRSRGGQSVGSAGSGATAATAAPTGVPRLLLVSGALPHRTLPAMVELRKSVWYFQKRQFVLLQNPFVVFTF